MTGAPWFTPLVIRGETLVTLIGLSGAEVLYRSRDASRTTRMLPALEGAWARGLRTGGWPAATG
jgi:hypothetical protein